MNPIFRRSPGRPRRLAEPCRENVTEEMESFGMVQCSRPNPHGPFVGCDDRLGFKAHAVKSPLLTRIKTPDGSCGTTDFLAQQRHRSEASLSGEGQIVGHHENSAERSAKQVQMAIATARVSAVTLASRGFRISDGDDDSGCAVSATLVAVQLVRTSAQSLQTHVQLEYRARKTWSI